jgi:hypothetical protein
MKPQIKAVGFRTQMLMATKAFFREIRVNGNDLKFYAILVTSILPI